MNGSALHGKNGKTTGCIILWPTLDFAGAFDSTLLDSNANKALVSPCGKPGQEEDSPSFPDGLMNLWERPKSEDQPISSLTPLAPNFEASQEGSLSLFGA